MVHVLPLTAENAAVCYAVLRPGLAAYTGPNVPTPPCPRRLRDLPSRNFASVINPTPGVKALIRNGTEGGHRGPQSRAVLSESG